MNGWVEIEEGMMADYRGSILLCRVGEAGISLQHLDPPTTGIFEWCRKRGYTHWRPAPAPLTALGAARKWARDGQQLCQAVEDEAAAGRSVRPAMEALIQHIAITGPWADHFWADCDDGN